MKRGKKLNKKDALVKFYFRSLPKNNSFLSQRYALFYLTRHLRFENKPVEAIRDDSFFKYFMRQLIKRRRNFIYAYKRINGDNVGCMLLDTLLNCSPSCISTTPATMSCLRVRICPFCWTRSYTANLYDDIAACLEEDNLYYRTDDGKQHAKITVVSDIKTVRLDHGEPSTAYFAAKELFKAKDSPLDKAKTQLGYYKLVTIEPILTGYQLVSRRLLFGYPKLLSRYQFKDLFDKDKNQVIKVLHKPSYTELSAIIGTVTMFPANMLTYNEPARICDILHNKPTGIGNLSNRYGRLRQLPSVATNVHHAASKDEYL